MNHSALLLMTLCMTGCLFSPKELRVEDLPHYGQALPGTIHVMVMEGFRHPGHYHLPKDATLGQLLDLAKLKPFAWGVNYPKSWQFIAVETERTAKKRVVNREGQAGLTICEEDRHFHLRDAQLVRCSSFTW